MIERLKLGIEILGTYQGLLIVDGNNIQCPEIDKKLEHTFVLLESTYRSGRGNQVFVNRAHDLFPILPAPFPDRFRFFLSDHLERGHETSPVGSVWVPCRGDDLI